MIDGPGHSTGHAIPRKDKEETTMLKTISAALLAVSVLAAPALAATLDKTAPAPVSKTVQVKPVNKAAQVKPVKPSLLNANAHMGRHHHVRHARHHGFHKHMGALKTHKFSKVSIKHVGSATKRG
jgi:hypothetical protein